MLKFVSTACAALMAVSVPFAAPAVAMPMPAPVWDGAQVTQVQLFRDQRRVDRDGRTARDFRGDRRAPRDERVVRRGSNYYYRGHRGYRDPRPGYRRHGDFWFPPAAFALGAIVGGAIANQPPTQYRPRGNAHVEWCYNRYRSYRASDNTFQPYNGPRRQCSSPYG